MNEAMSPMGIEQLLAHFLIGALGLRLESPIREVSHVPPSRYLGSTARADPSVCAAWNTDQGVVTIAGTYDRAQSQQLHMHVLLIEWWIAPTTHHRGWWRCSARRPREWTRGYGSEPSLSRSVHIPSLHRDPPSGVDEAMHGILDTVGSGRCDA